MEPFEKADKAISILTRFRRWIYSKAKRSEGIDVVLKEHEAMRQTDRDILESLEELKGQLSDVDSDIKDMRTNLSLLKNGVQKTLRSDLINSYHNLKRKGCATSFEKREFDDSYTTYHQLGKNGMMDVYHDEIMHMPECKEE